MNYNEINARAIYMLDGLNASFDYLNAEGLFIKDTFVVNLYQQYTMLKNSAIFKEVDIADVIKLMSVVHGYINTYNEIKKEKETIAELAKLSLVEIAVRMVKLETENASLNKKVDDLSRRIDGQMYYFNQELNNVNKKLN